MVAKVRPYFRHMGINVNNIDKMTEFYCELLGFVVSDRGVASFGSRIVFLTQDEEEHHQLVLVDGRPSRIEFNSINQVSCKLGSLQDLKTFAKELRSRWFLDYESVDHGNAWSIYFSDPEENVVECYVDTPFYTPQPCREPLDLKKSEEEILDTTETMCRKRKGFLTRSEWISSMKHKLSIKKKK